MDYKKLGEFCYSPRQREVFDALLVSGSQGKAARALGISCRSVERTVRRVKEAATRQGYSPDHDMTHTAPDGFHVKGVSTYYNEEGKLTGQWVKTSQDAERQKALMAEAVDAMCSDIKPAKPVKKAKAQTDPNLCNVYVITYYHMGMKSWGEQTGADWDLDIAERTLIEYFKHAIGYAPKASKAVFAQIGDFLHIDSLASITPTSGHLLDSDTRYEKMVRVTIRVLRAVQAMLLKKYDEVHIIHAEGNHDLASSVWLREMFAALYEDEPRITVETSPDPYYSYEHGKTSLFFHHGHRKKLSQLDQVMASKFRELFGKTKHSYCHAGHLHHERSYESSLMITEQHRTLAAPDAYASTHGYMSGRSSPVITYHKDFGEVSRLNISPDMIR